VRRNDFPRVGCALAMTLTVLGRLRGTRFCTSECAQFTVSWPRDLLILGQGDHILSIVDLHVFIKDDMVVWAWESLLSNVYLHVFIKGNFVIWEPSPGSHQQHLRSTALQLPDYDLFLQGFINVHTAHAYKVLQSSKVVLGVMAPVHFTIRRFGC
jgi:hypothetical protein